SRSQEQPKGAVAPESRKGSKLVSDSAAAYDPNWDQPYVQFQPLGKALQPCPDLKPGEICAQDLSIYGGSGKTSLSSVNDVETFEAFFRMCSAQKPKVTEERRTYIAQRYHFSGAVSQELLMTRGKPVPVGPVVRLPEGITSWEELAALGCAEIRERNLFPLGFRPLSHPLHTVGHQLFPQS